MNVSSNSGSTVGGGMPGLPSMKSSPLSADTAFHSPVSGTGGPSPSFVSLEDRKSLKPTEKLVVANHITNTGILVNFTEIIYSNSMRGYRVYRCEHQVSPFFRLLNTSNILILAASLSLLLSCFVHSSASQVHLLHWLKLSGPTDTSIVHLSSSIGPEKQSEVISSSKLRVIACVFSWLFFLQHLLSAYRNVYVEEVLAIRGIGVQFTSFGIFNQVREKRFIDRKLIRSIVIHDAFYRYQPIFFLSSSIENEPKRLVYFRETLPRLEVLRHTLIGICHVLYGEERHGQSLADIQTMTLPAFGNIVSTPDESGGEETIISDDS